MDSVRLPTPWAVGQALIGVFGYSDLIASSTFGEGWWWPHIWRTTVFAIGGSTLGMALGVVIGLVLARFPALRLALDVPIEVLRALPPLALIPFFLLWFGTSTFGAFAFIVIYAFRMLLINTLNAADNVAPVHVDYVRTLGASKRTAFRTVVLPAIVPELVGGARVTLSVAWGITIIAELMGAREGIGRLVSAFVPFLATSQIMAAMIVVAILATISDRVLMMGVRPFIRWVPESTK